MNHIWKNEKAHSVCRRCGLLRVEEPKNTFDSFGKRAFHKYRFPNQSWSPKRPECFDPRQSELFNVRGDKQEEVFKTLKEKEDDELDKKYPWIPDQIKDDNFFREVVRTFPNSIVTKVRVPKPAAQPEDDSIEEDDDIQF